MQAEDAKMQFRASAFALIREGYSTDRLRSLATSFSSAPLAIAGMAGKFGLRKTLALAPDWVGRAFGMPTFGKVRFGDLAGTKPIGEVFGGNRGLPVDRYYIEYFLAANSDVIEGRVLEVQEDDYTKRFGGAAVTHSDVLYLSEGWPGATIWGDLTDPNCLPKEAFDCLIITQTLHLIYDMRAALATLYASLKPGGVLLLTVPGITPIDPGEWGEYWLWTLTETSAHRLVAESFGTENIQCKTYGNVFSAISFLTGLATEELPAAKLDVFDKSFPMIIGVRATKAR
jgi:SAM-dependent methyltransferase